MTQDNGELILAAAIGKPPEQRAAYLDAACGPDTELRRRIERRLLLHDERNRSRESTSVSDTSASAADATDQSALMPETQARGGLDAAALETAALGKDETGVPSVSGVSVQSGQRFADYELLEKIGIGGMGVVYKARQFSLNRVVALKMIKSGELADAEAHERFHKEAEAAANLDHPGIVPAYEVGEYQGQHYFSMGYIDGKSLAERLKNGPLPPREAAELISKIAEAVDYANQQGVIHRDLKPGNILITQAGIPRITDFGLAKRIEEDSALTATGQILGTPSFMPPEQAAGRLDVGPGADVYALGAILYNLLTGRPPFQAANVMDTLRQVLERDPIAPRQLNPTVPRDLETICLKCLSKAPERRYESAGQFDEDIKRWLDKKPILARPIGRSERAVQWCRRRPAVAALLAVVLLVTTVCFGLVAWQWQRAEANYAAAVENFNESERQREQRDVNFQKALEAVDKMLTRAGEKSLVNVPGMSQVRRDLLEDALNFYQGFLDEKSEDPELIAETGRAYRRIGGIQQLLEEHDQAEASLEHAIVLFERLGERFSGRAEFRQELAGACDDLGVLLLNLARYQEAEPMFRRAVELNDALEREFPQNPDRKLELANALLSLGSLLENTQRESEAEQTYLAAMDLYDTLGASATATSPKCRNQRAQCHFALGGLLQNTGRPSDSEEQFGESLAMRESLVRDFPKQTKFRRDLATSYRVLGEFLISSGRLPEASHRMDEAIATFEQLAADFPHVPDYRSDLAACCNVAAILRVRLGKSDEVEPFFRRQVSILEQLVAEYPKRIAFGRELGTAYNNLGILLDQTRRREESIIVQDKALTLRRRLAEQYPDSPDLRAEVGISCQALAYLLPEEQSDKAEELLREAIRLGETLVSESPENPRYEHKLAQCYRTLGDRLTDDDPEQAELYLVKAASTFGRLGTNFPGNAQYHRFHAFSLDALGRLQFARGRVSDAEKSLQGVSRILEKLVADFEGVAQFRRERAAGRISLGRFLALVGEYEEATTCLRQALDELEQLNAQTPGNALVETDLLRSHDALARLLSTWKPVDDRDLEQALEHARTAVEGDGENADLRTTLGMVQYQRGEWTAALDTFDPDGDETDCLFIAMSHRRLGNTGDADRFYDKAVEAMKEGPLTDAELELYRRQAATVLERRP